MTTPRSTLSPDKRTPAVAEATANFHRDVVDQVRTAVEKDPVVVVGMAQNPFVKRVRQALTEAGIQFTYLEYGNYFGQWKQRLAIKMWSGWPTFPQVYVRGVLIGGFEDTRKALDDGSLRKLLGG
ncbi:MAG TPA: glutaredoxin domain-containing protein [Archangium sp.]|jgi:glutaredoxin-related protein|uniref:glutaredoxin domain-containing protein n=1 Tax=Archangium sp. TaxID=1872627 RepID=UPI002ED83BD5